jgi:hypothetical protein
MIEIFKQILLLSFSYLEKNKKIGIGKKKELKNASEE